MRRINSELVLVALLISGPVSAQEFGQWSWNAGFETNGRSYDNESDGESVGTFDQTDLKLSLGLNGFIFHPALAEFRLGLDALFSSYEGGRTLDTDRTGLSADLALLPRGPYPARLSFQRQTYDYSGLGAEDPLTLLGAPDLITTYGGRVHLRRGALRGTLAGFERSSLDFLDPGSEAQIQERDFLDWSRSGKKGRRHLRLERRLRDFGIVDFSQEDLTLNFDEHNQVGDRWRWDLAGTAIRRSLRFEENPEIDIDSFRLRSQLLHTTARGDLLTLTQGAGQVESDTGPATSTYSLGARYLRRWESGWQLGPFASWSMQRTDGASLGSPQLGMAAIWRRPRRVDILVNSSASYLFFDRQGGRREGNDSSVAAFLETTVQHGSERKLRKQLEISASRNELRAAGETLDDLPDLGTPLAGLGTENRYRGRVTLQHRWDSTWGSAYSEWSRRESSPGENLEDFYAETRSQTLQLSRRRLNFLASAGDTRIGTSSTDEQEIRSRSTTLAWRATRSFWLRASYREDDRQVQFGPDIASERSEAGIELRVGAFVLKGQGFLTRESLDGGAERVNRGLNWSLSRAFAGWLPVVTGTERRGVIR